MSRRIFGEGLNNILSMSKLSMEQVTSHPSVHREFKIVLPQEIIPSKYQPRKDFDQESLRELANSIKEKGILQPLVVRKVKDEYELIAGERRWRAAQMAGLKQLPVIICDIDDNNILAYSIIENIQRQDLNPIEEAMSLKRLLEEFSMTHEAVAKAIGRSRTMVTNMLRLLNLAEPVKNMLAGRQLEMGHARALLSLSEEQQIEVAKAIHDRGMTVRNTEIFVRNVHISTQSQEKSFVKNFDYLAWEKRLSEKLGVKTKIQVNMQGKGRVVSYFSNTDSLKEILDKILGDII